MSSAAEPNRAVPVEVLPPVPREAELPTALRERPPFEGLNTFYHPASGVIILGLDWLIFGSDLVTDFLALPLMCVVAFVLSFPLIFAVQRKWSMNEVGPALGKAFLGAFLVALPFPITGTLLGAAILALSGLPHHPVEVVKRLASSPTTTK